MPRAKQSVSDRIVADVLSLPHQEATLLVSFLQTTLRQIAPTSRVLSRTTAPKPVVVSDVVTVGEATVGIVHSAKPTRRPRIARPAAAPPVEVPAADAVMEVMEVGEEQ